MVESDKKLKFKEEIVIVVMVVREVVEKLLRLVDIRVFRLRDRLEELIRQFENFDNKDDISIRTRFRYVCWLWEWFGIDFVGYRRIEESEQ